MVIGLCENLSINLYVCKMQIQCTTNDRSLTSFGAELSLEGLIMNANKQFYYLPLLRS